MFFFLYVFVIAFSISDNSLIESQSAAASMKGILSSSGFPSEALTCGSPLCKQVTRQRNGQIGPEEMAVNGQPCER